MTMLASGPKVQAPVRSPIVGALVAQQKGTSHFGEDAWRRLDKVADRAGLLTGRSLLNDVRRAEAQGLVEVEERDGVPFVTLSALALSLFGIRAWDDRPRGLGATAAGRSPVAEVDDPDRVAPDQPEEPLVEVLLGWWSATPLVEALADHLGRDVEVVWDEVQELERRGLVETWPDHPAGPAVVLSALTIERNRLRLASDGSRWLQPWQADPTVDETDLRIWNESDCGDDPDLPALFDSMPDPDALDGPTSLDASEAADERAEEILNLWTDATRPEPRVLDRRPTSDEAWAAACREDARRPIFLPQPKIVLGSSLAWPALVPGTERRWTPGDGPCPGCWDRGLAASTFCLVCQRSGLDDLIRYMLSIEASRPARRVRPEPRPSREAKRAERRSAQARHLPALTLPGLRGGLGA